MFQLIARAGRPRRAPRAVVLLCAGFLTGCGSESTEAPVAGAPAPAPGKDAPTKTIGKAKIQRPPQ